MAYTQKVNPVGARTITDPRSLSTVCAANFVAGMPAWAHIVKPKGGGTARASVSPDANIGHFKNFWTHDQVL
jgi:hypothetical protein